MIDAIHAFATKRPMRAKRAMTVALPSLGNEFLLFSKTGYGIGLTRTPRGLGASTDLVPRTAHPVRPRTASRAGPPHGRCESAT